MVTSNDPLIEINKWAPQEIASVVSIVETTNLPTDRKFRNAWEAGVNDSIVVNMTKARLIHMNRIRFFRDKKLIQTDADMLKAIELGLDTTTLKTERQRLRDIPQTFDLTRAITPEELDALWPVGLDR